MNHPLLLIIVKITIFSLMLSIGINLSLDKMLALWRRPDLLFRALLAVVVLVPLTVMILLKLLHLPPEVMTGLALLAASPGAPLSTKRSQMAGARFHHSASLQLTLALIAVLVTPLTLGLFTGLFPEMLNPVTMLEVAKQVTMVQFLPVILGLLLQRFGANYAAAIARPLMFIANGLFWVLIVLASMVGIPILFKVWGLPLFAIAMIVIVSLGIGHTLGGPDEEKRSILAISCIARNVGLALFIAILNGLEQQVMPTLIAYLILGAVMCVLYSICQKRTLAQFPHIP